MKILMVCHELPSPYTGCSLRPFNLIRYLSEKHGHSISVVSFKEKTSESRYNYNLEEYCYFITSLDIMDANASFLKRAFYTIKNMVSLQNIFSKNFIFMKFYYSPKMQSKINNLLIEQDFDVIYSDISMDTYIDNVDLPKIIEPLDALSESYHQLFSQEKNPAKKVFWLVQYLKTKKHEKNVYNKFDYCIVVTERDKEILESYVEKSIIKVIPNGVDISYFKPISVKENYPSLIFVGDMSSLPNTSAIIYFYNEIYSLIKNRVRHIKLFIVGRNPSKEIFRLSLDKSITVTGYVEDVRPYLSSASIVIAPMILGTGIKNKILEAMAMEKPVISTSFGARGIDISSEENIIIADEPEEFAERVVELLEDERLRQRIANNGRKLVETNYSWEKMADILNNLFEEIVRTHESK